MPTNGTLVAAPLGLGVVAGVGVSVGLVVAGSVLCDGVVVVAGSSVVCSVGWGCSVVCSLVGTVFSVVGEVSWVGASVEAEVELGTSLVAGAGVVLCSWCQYSKVRA